MIQQLKRKGPDRTGGSKPQGAVIVRHDFCNVKTGINKVPLYDVGIPPPAEQLGEPSRLFREPTQSYLVQVSFVVKDAGTVDEGTHLF